MYEKTKCEVTEESKDLTRTDKSYGINHNSVGTTPAYHTSSKESSNAENHHHYKIKQTSHLESICKGEHWQISKIKSN